jgi:hypothetical protein
LGVCLPLAEHFHSFHWRKTVVSEFTLGTSWTEVSDMAFTGEVQTSFSGESCDCGFALQPSNGGVDSCVGFSHGVIDTTVKDFFSIVLSLVALKLSDPSRWILPKIIHSRENCVSQRVNYSWLSRGNWQWRIQHQCDGGLRGVRVS